MVLTHEEYIEAGGKLDVTAFNKNIVRACSVLDDATSGRLEKMQSIPLQVKAACVDLVEYLYTNTERNNVTSKSNSTGPVSESESYQLKSSAEQREDINRIITDYLGSVTDDVGTPLLYRGCDA